MRWQTMLHLHVIHSNQVASSLADGETGFEANICATHYEVCVLLLHPWVDLEARTQT